jgi:hypothetical protein
VTLIASPTPGRGDQALTERAIVTNAGPGEATGVTLTLVLPRCAVQQGWQVSVVNPVQVRDWARSQGRRAKTDAQDALLLARYAAEQPARPPLPPPPPVSELESLLRRQDDLEHCCSRNAIGSASWRRARVLRELCSRASSGASPTSRPRAAIEQAIRDQFGIHPALGRYARRLLRHSYERLVDRGKAKFVAQIAIARTLLVWARADFRAGDDFNPQKVRAAIPTA